jgi:uncharacterized protein YjbI with pentapeptide repeats
MVTKKLEDRGVYISCGFENIIENVSVHQGTFVNSVFAHCLLDESFFRSSVFVNVRFIDCSLEYVDFSWSVLRRVIFLNCTLDYGDWSRARVDDLGLRQTNLPANLRVYGTDFRSVGLPEGTARHRVAINIKDCLVPPEWGDWFRVDKGRVLKI